MNVRKLPGAALAAVMSAMLALSSCATPPNMPKHHANGNHVAKKHYRGEVPYTADWGACLVSVTPIAGDAKYIIDFPGTLKKLQFVNVYESPRDLYLALKSFPSVHGECWPASSGSPAPSPQPSRDSMTIRVPATADGGVSTGINLTAGRSYTISATGSAKYGYDPGDPCPGYPSTSPDGSRYLGSQNCGPKYDPSAAMPTAPIGLLIWKVGNGSWQPAPTSFTATTAGLLYLSYNDDPGTYDNNSGSYTATVTCSPGC